MIFLHVMGLILIIVSMIIGLVAAWKESMLVFAILLFGIGCVVFRAGDEVNKNGEDV